FEMTLDAVRRAEFDMIYAFIYSPRGGTPAAKREDQVPDSVKSERFSRLIECQNEISKAHNEREVGKTLRVLMDDDLSRAKTGRTDGNRQIHVEGNASAGKFVNVLVTRADTYNLFGRAIDDVND
ncbi:MAG: TRAM domain-containing protein, partial [Firmicutes bacterium]|nr:TRAM domain-containing protein [Bacillota bacterium]